MFINYIIKCLQQSILFLAMFSLMTTSISAMGNTTPVGSWHGEISVSGNKVPLIFHISIDESNKVIATMDSPAQGAKGIPVKDVIITDRSIKLNIAVANAVYEGKLDDNLSLIQGVWQQSGQSFELILKQHTVDIVGLWKGKLQGTVVEFSLDVSMNENNQAVANLSPNDGISKVQVSNLTKTKEQFSFEVPAEGVTYNGYMNKENKEIKGLFSQGNREFKLNFYKSEKSNQVKLNRPQHPVKPYLYNDENIIFENNNIKLAGTLTTPKGNGPYPAVVLISGSGPQDRDQTFMGHKTFLVLADHLTKSGIAVLRFDDRGFAKSTGDFTSATSLDFASDVKAAVDFLTKHPRIDVNNIGLIGHSEGGLIAPIVASQSDNIAFIALMAGPGISGNDIAIEQIKTILSVNGLSDAAAEAGSNITRQLNEVIINQSSVNFESLLTRTYEKAWSSLSKPIQDELKKVGGGSISKARINMLTSSWNQYFLTHQPEAYLSKLSIPVMAIHGNKDKQMTAAVNLQAIEAALNPSSKHLVREMDGLNHLFQTANTGLMTEYSQITETIAPKVLNEMNDWILSVVTK